MTRLGSARLGEAWLGSAWFRGLVQFSGPWSGSAWLDMAGYDAARHGLSQL